MTTTIRSSADGSKSYIQVGGTDVVTLGTQGIEAGSYAPGSITPVELSQKLTSGTVVASTSGTSIDFTGIPSWVKRITVMLDGVSTSGTSLVIIQLGDSGGVENTGYISSAATPAGTVASGVDGIRLMGVSTAANVWSGSVVFSKINENTWTATSLMAIATSVHYGAGSKTLTGVLDRIRLTTINGTDTFDAGTVNVMWE